MPLKAGHFSVKIPGQVSVEINSAALNRKKKDVGRPQTYATINDLDVVSLPDNQTKT